MQYFCGGLFYGGAYLQQMYLSFFSYATAHAGRVCEREVGALRADHPYLHAGSANISVYANIIPIYHFVLAGGG